MKEPKWTVVCCSTPGVQTSWKFNLHVIYWVAGSWRHVMLSANNIRYMSMSSGSIYDKIGSHLVEYCESRDLFWRWDVVMHWANSTFFSIVSLLSSKNEISIRFCTFWNFEGSLMEHHWAGSYSGQVRMSHKKGPSNRTVLLGNIY